MISLLIWELLEPTRCKQLLTYFFPYPSGLDNVSGKRNVQESNQWEADASIVNIDKVRRNLQKFAAASDVKVFCRLV